MYDYIVVGKGLMGSAAFRYLSAHAPNTLLIGPDEPKELATHDGVFGAHYDQGRLSHLLGKDAVWGVLGERSLQAYAGIEEASGIQFFYPIGGVYVEAPSIATGYFELAKNANDRFESIEVEWLDHQQRKETFPYFNFPEGSRLVWEKMPAGYINPRKMVEAQAAAGQKSGGDVVREMVVDVEDNGDSFTVVSRAGNRYQGRKLLIAAGAFSNGFGLLPKPAAFTYKGEYVILGEIDPAELASIADMPTVIYKLESPYLSDIYMVPPVQYPDGAYYIKMGANTHKDQYPETIEQICDWYRSGDSDAMMPAMKDAITSMIPNLKPLSWRTSRCVICYTAHRKPYIDIVEPDRIYIAAGGNGSSAYCSDAIGKLAAKLTIHNEWRDDLDVAEFAVSFA